MFYLGDFVYLVSLVHFVYLVYLVYLVYFVGFVYLVERCQSMVFFEAFLLSQLPDG